MARTTVTFNVAFSINMAAESVEELASVTFYKLAGALDDAVHTFVQESDTLSDYLQEAMPDGVEFTGIDVGAATVMYIGDSKNED